MVMGLYTGKLIFGGGGAYIRNGLSVSEMVGLYLGELIFGGGAYNRRFTVFLLNIPHELLMSF